MSTTLKLSDSHVERGSTANPQYKKYEDKLRQMKNQDGEIDIAELCQVLDEASTIEKHRKLLRGACYVLVVFSLLTIAAIVGLTYAIVDLTQDSQVSSSHILVTKNSAANHVATGRALLFDDASHLFNKSLEDLSDLKFLILPGGKTGAGTVVHVAEVELDPNTSAKVTTTAGAVYEIDASGIHQVNKTSGGRRKLLQVASGAMAGSTSSSAPAVPTPTPVSPNPTSVSPNPTPSPVGNLVGTPAPLQTSGVATVGSTSSTSVCNDCSCAQIENGMPYCCGNGPCVSNADEYENHGCTSGDACLCPSNSACNIIDGTCVPGSSTTCAKGADCNYISTYGGTPSLTCCDLQAACPSWNSVTFVINQAGTTPSFNGISTATCACMTVDGAAYGLYASPTCNGGVCSYINTPYGK